MPNAFPAEKGIVAEILYLKGPVYNSNIKNVGGGVRNNMQVIKNISLLALTFMPKIFNIITVFAFMGQVFTKI